MKQNGQFAHNAAAAGLLAESTEAEGLGTMHRHLLHILLLLTGVGLFAQPDTVNVPHSSNGWYLSPHGTIRILVIFAEVDYDKDPSKDPQRDGSKDWHKGEMPGWKDDLFDPFPLAEPKAEGDVFNVGNDHEITIKELALKVKEKFEPGVLH